MTHHRNAASLPRAAGRNTDMAAVIAGSHRRSEDYGLRPGARPDFSRLSAADLSMLVERNRSLTSHALPAMETLYQQIANTHHMVLLTDADGVILHALGDADFLEKANRVALSPGVTWSERSKGTNAIGTAITEGAPTTIHADQHYLAANHFLTCSAAPIVDHRGDVVGVLDVSGDRHNHHQHTMALVRMSALMIENQIFTANFNEAITLHFHARPEFIGTLMEGIASFTQDGRFLAANRAAMFQLGLSYPMLHAHTFDSLFGLPVAALYEHVRSAAGLLDLSLHNGVRVRGRAELRLTRRMHMPAAMPDAAVSQSHSHSQSQPQPQPHWQPQAQSVSAPTAAPSGLRALDTGDARMAQLVDKVGKVLGRGIPILILGETGSGKEWLARAIHQDSPRVHRPFVAVNCASIPETLIESELFGYEEGAFTGARKRGATGKIQQADGGTLFLDEIGDMPFSLQACLLRVLQERAVTPLGSARPVAVDVELVCATNHDLRQRIAAGLFREDLYYRLNGLVVKLPPLRARTDLPILVRNVLAPEANGKPPRTAAPPISDEVLRLFARHRWPGNLRQLASLLRTAAIMAGADQIGLRHLPDDFLDDLDAPGDAGNSTHHRAKGHHSDDVHLTDKHANGAAATRLGDMALGAILASLEAHGGNVSAAARALGISRNTIYRKLPHPKQPG
jgi:transcriptional regulator of acetoin/glycerol metabolism